MMTIGRDMGGSKERVATELAFATEKANRRAQAKSRHRTRILRVTPSANAYIFLVGHWPNGAGQGPACVLYICFGLVGLLLFTPE